MPCPSTFYGRAATRSRSNLRSRAGTRETGSVTRRLSTHKQEPTLHQNTFPSAFHGKAATRSRSSSRSRFPRRETVDRNVARRKRNPQRSRSSYSSRFPRWEADDPNVARRTRKPQPRDFRALQPQRARESASSARRRSRWAKGLSRCKQRWPRLSNTRTTGACMQACMQHPSSPRWLVQFARLRCHKDRGAHP